MLKQSNLQKQKEYFDIHRTLLRTLKRGEMFKVKEGYMDNTNQGMLNLQGTWLKVSAAYRVRSESRDYFDNLFEEHHLPIYDYSVEMNDGNNPFAESDHWYEYHMDIYATNLEITRVDNRGLFPETPKLPLL